MRSLKIDITSLSKNKSFSAGDVAAHKKLQVAQRKARKLKIKKEKKEKEEKRGSDSGNDDVFIKPSQSQKRPREIAVSDPDGVEDEYESATSEAETEISEIFSEAEVPLSDRDTADTEVYDSATSEIF